MCMLTHVATAAVVAISTMHIIIANFFSIHFIPCHFILFFVFAKENKKNVRNINGHKHSTTRELLKCWKSIRGSDHFWPSFRLKTIQHIRKINRDIALNDIREKFYKMVSNTMAASVNAEWWTNRQWFKPYNNSVEYTQQNKTMAQTIIIYFHTFFVVVVVARHYGLCYVWDDDDIGIL